MAYWLMKSEPDVYGWDDLEAEVTASLHERLVDLCETGDVDAAAGVAVEAEDVVVDGVDRGEARLRGEGDLGAGELHRP